MTNAHFHDEITTEVNPMATAQLTRDEVLSALRDGGSLWYFYLRGSCRSRQERRAVKGAFCPMSVFEALREEGIIQCTDREKSGYPYYANGDKNSRYSLKA